MPLNILSPLSLGSSEVQPIVVENNPASTNPVILSSGVAGAGRINLLHYKKKAV